LLRMIGTAHPERRSFDRGIFRQKSYAVSVSMYSTVTTGKNNRTWKSSVVKLNHGMQIH